MRLVTPRNCVAGVVMSDSSEPDIEANHRRAYQNELSIMKTLTMSALLFVATVAHAQSFVLEMPLRSPAAEVTQRIGLTDIDIRYHRPQVNGRKIWGDLVPYGKLWRTGANTITT